MSHRSRLRAGAGALLCSLVGAPLVALAAVNPPAAGSSQVPEEDYHGIAYATGGISPDEAATYRAQSNRFSLALEVLEKTPSDKRDEFTAGAQVRIKHGTRTVFDSKTGGPFMLVRLDPGVYSVEATLGARTLQKASVHVSAGRTTHETFEFPAHTD